MGRHLEKLACLSSCVEGQPPERISTGPPDSTPGIGHASPSALFLFFFCSSLGTCSRVLLRRRLSDHLAGELRVSLSSFLQTLFAPSSMSRTFFFFFFRLRVKTFLVVLEFPLFSPTEDRSQYEKKIAPSEASSSSSLSMSKHPHVSPTNRVADWLKRERFP